MLYKLAEQITPAVLAIYVFYLLYKHHVCHYPFCINLVFVFQCPPYSTRTRHKTVTVTTLPTMKCRLQNNATTYVLKQTTV